MTYYNKYIPMLKVIIVTVFSAFLFSQNDSNEIKEEIEQQILSQQKSKVIKTETLPEAETNVIILPKDE